MKGGARGVWKRQRSLTGTEASGGYRGVWGRTKESGGERWVLRGQRSMEETDRSEKGQRSLTGTEVSGGDRAVLKKKRGLYRERCLEGNRGVWRR